MALTDHIKHARVNLVTGETNHVYYEDTEWAEVQALRSAGRLPKAKDHKKLLLKQQGQREVDAIIRPPQLFQAQVRALELLEVRIEGGSWSTEETQERAALQAILDQTRAIRARERTALTLVDIAETVAEVRAVEM